MIEQQKRIKTPQVFDAPQHFAVDPLPLDEQLTSIAADAARAALKEITSQPDDGGAKPKRARKRPKMPAT